MKYIVILLSILLLSGCGRTDRSDSNETITEDDIANYPETVSNQTENYINKNESEEISNTEETVSIQKELLEPSPPSEKSRIGILDSNGDFEVREELLKDVKEYGGISKDEELYYPKLKIEGFKLYRTVIDEWSFLYYYAPESKLSEEYIFEFNDGILLGYDRTHWIDTEDPLGSEMRKYDLQNIEYTYKENILVRKNTAQVEGVVGNTRFTLIATDKMNDEELLFELGKAVIDSTETIAINNS